MSMLLSRKLSSIVNIFMSKFSFKLTCHTSVIDLLLDEIKAENIDLIGDNLDCCANNVLVVQPYIKWGPNKNEKTSPDLQLQESIGLINSIKDWNVIAGFKLPVKSFRSQYVFGSGNLEKLKELVAHCPEVNSLFVSQGMLNVAQKKKLQDHLGLTVIDRYIVVLNIFRLHAKSHISKLQCALAEIPYLNMHFRSIHENKGQTVSQFSVKQIARSGETFWQKRMSLLKERERKLKKALYYMKKHRQLLRQQRMESKIPSVAVVGYTNCGKTSLIKALTSDESLVPEDRFFATLDVTAHEGRLLNQIPIIYYDTVGFISDLPLSLIASFHSTLEDALIADIILHIEDLSHPDMKYQSYTVKRTLSKLMNVSQKNIPIFTVGNKIDLIDTGSVPDDTIAISATTLTGINNMEERIRDLLLESQDHSIETFRVKSGGSEYSWIMKNCPVISYKVDELDTQYLYMEVMTNPKLSGQFKKTFNTNTNQ